MLTAPRQASALLEPLIAAHGGRTRWRRLQRLTARLDSGGLAFASHGQPFALRGLEMTLEPSQPRVTLRHFSGYGREGIWTPGHVAILDQDGDLIDERHEPRESFSRPIKRLLWDKLDILYFAGYALWNYLSFPFLLESAGIRLKPGPGNADLGLHRIDARFPPGFATHSSEQQFWIDHRQRLVRHDYVAEVIGPWASAGHCCRQETEVGGLRFYTRRQVLPRLGPRKQLWPFPTLVWIHLDELQAHMQSTREEV